MRNIIVKKYTVAGIFFWSFILIFLFPASAEIDAIRDNRTFRDCTDCPEMVVVPAGTFTMGTSEAEAKQVIDSVSMLTKIMARNAVSTEQPAHSVTIESPVAVGKYPVTREQFAYFVRTSGYIVKTNCTILADHKTRYPDNADWQHPGFSQTDRDPVVCVSWRDAQAYVVWLNSLLRGGQTVSSAGMYRLPTEAEWEYAARAGTHTTRWWGDLIGSNNANCDDCGSRWDNKLTAPVGLFGPNPFGLYDLLGNAWEWTEDCWNNTYTGAPTDGRAWNTGNCDRRVARGGDWGGDTWVLRSADRTSFDIDKRANYIGFRIVKVGLE